MKFLSVIIALVAFAAPAFMQESKPAAEGPKFSAPLKVAAKDACYYTLHEESRVNITLPAEAGGQTQNVENDSTFGLDFIVDEVKDGKVTATFTVASIKGSMTIEPLGTFEFDSAKPEEGGDEEPDPSNPAAMFETIMKKMSKLVGTQIKAVFNADGTLESLSEVTPKDAGDPVVAQMRVGAVNGLITELKQGFAFHPAAPQAIGDVWEQSAAVPIRGAKMTPKGQTKLVAADEQMIEISHQASIPATPDGADMQGLTVDVAQGSVKAKAKWSRKDGLPLSISTETSMEGTATTEQIEGELAMNLGAKFTMTRTEKPAAAASRPAESKPAK